MSEWPSYWYLASPYSLYPGGHNAAWVIACRAYGELRRHRVPVYSPIAAGHAAVLHGNLGSRGQQFWYDTNEPLLRAAHGVIVLMADGWDASEGVRYEIDAMAAMERPIVYMQPGLVPHELLTMLPAL